MVVQEERHLEVLNQLWPCNSYSMGEIYTPSFLNLSEEIDQIPFYSNDTSRK